MSCGAKSQVGYGGGAEGINRPGGRLRASCINPFAAGRTLLCRPYPALLPPNEADQSLATKCPLAKSLTPPPLCTPPTPKRRSPSTPCGPPSAPRPPPRSILNAYTVVISDPAAAAQVVAQVPTRSFNYRIVDEVGRDAAEVGGGGRAGLHPYASRTSMDAIRGRCWSTVPECQLIGNRVFA